MHLNELLELQKQHRDTRWGKQNLIRSRHYTCEHCNKEYKDGYAFKKHINAAHLEQKNFECNVCGNQFVKRSDLARHLNRKYSHIFACQMKDCGQVFASALELKNHTIKHLTS
jgi:uncharacterized C2H2 Zn-finger protein